MFSPEKPTIAEEQRTPGCGSGVVFLTGGHGVSVKPEDLNN